MCIYQCYVAYMNAMCNISTSKHVRYKLKVSDKTKRCFIKDEEAEMISQKRKWCHYVPRLLAKARAFPWIQNASAGATTWPPDTERFFMELSTMITRAQQQRNATATTQFDSSEFFVLQSGRIRNNFKCSNGLFMIGAGPVSEISAHPLIS